MIRESCFPYLFISDSNRIHRNFAHRSNVGHFSDSWTVLSVGICDSLWVCPFPIVSTKWQIQRRLKSRVIQKKFLDILRPHELNPTKPDIYSHTDLKEYWKTEFTTEWIVKCTLKHYPQISEEKRTTSHYCSCQITITIEHLLTEWQKFSF